jgi:hypothetical protein
MPLNSGDFLNLLELNTTSASIPAEATFKK